jgi:hypothetical protein
MWYAASSLISGSQSESTTTFTAGLKIGNFSKLDPQFTPQNSLTPCYNDTASKSTKATLCLTLAYRHH